MKLSVYILLAAVVPSMAWADFPTKARLAAARSTEAIIQNADKHKGHGHPQWAQLSNAGKDIFVIWNDPFSGRSATFVQAYYFNGNQWVLFLDELIDGHSSLTPKILVESNSLVFYARDSQKVLERSLNILKPLGVAKK
ncbi:MAG: hypothetical protein ACFUZC_14090 [Chthoniobacteraceae bacterium]